MTPEQDKPHFAQAAEILADIKKKAGNYAYLFETQAQLNQILSSKVDVGRAFVRLTKKVIKKACKKSPDKNYQNSETKLKTSMLSLATNG